MLDYEYYDDVDSIKEIALGDRVQRARKEHRCGDCYKQILPGMVYRSEFGLVDGEPYYMKTCYDCLLRQRG